MVMVDTDELTPGMLRGYYCGWIKRSEYLPEDKKRELIGMVQRHFQLMAQTTGMVELIWRRLLEIEKKQSQR